MSNSIQIPVPIKPCRKCGSFEKISGGARGLRCAPCKRASRRKFNQSEAGKAKQYRDNHSVAGKEKQRKYKASPNGHAKNIARQRKARGYPEPTRQCPSICEIPGCEERATRLDHCHVTGAFRGWLCRNHNFGIGLIGDTLEHARAVVQYLENTKVVDGAQKGA